MACSRRAAAAALAVLAAAAFSPAPAPGQGKVTIGVALAQDDNPLYILMLRGIRARAKELGWDVVAVSSNEDKLKQINGVQDLIARGVKGVLISPIDAVGVNAAYDAAAQAKIPIISLARGSSSPNQTLHVAINEKRIGAEIAEWTAKHIGGEGKVAMILGPSGAPAFRNSRKAIWRSPSNSMPSSGDGSASTCSTESSKVKRSASRCSSRTAWSTRRTSMRCWHARARTDLIFGA